MKEVSPDKGLQDARPHDYTEAEFDQAISDNEARQAGEAGPTTGPALSDDDVQQITVITLMRIYDVLGAILTHLDEDTATALLELHAQGKLAGPLPSLDI